jgi:hypothetical protein
MKSIFTRACASNAFVLAAALVAASVAVAHAQGPWQTLFNGKDFTGWTAASGGGGRAKAPPPPPPSTNPSERSWKIEGGLMSSVPTAISKQPSASLNTIDKFKDFELELEYKLDEAPNLQCTPKLGDAPGRNGQIQHQANLSKDASCTFNSGITFRAAYQLNLGRREAGEYVGIVVHRALPEAIRTNVDWLSTGDCGSKNHTYLEDCSAFPEIRKKGDWNKIRIMFKGNHLQAWMNEKQIVDVTDDPTDPAEAAWKEAGPINLQFPPAAEGGEFGNTGTVKFRNIRIRTL